MCLSEIAAKYTIKTAKKVKSGTYGYKAFRIWNGDETGLFSAYNYGDKSYKKGIWIEDKNSGRIISYKGNKKDTHSAGFFIAKTRIGAKHHVGFGISIFKVEYQNVVAEGYDCGCKTVVARKMKILEEVK